MDPFTADYLTNLAAELSAHMLAAIPAWVQSSWQGEETDRAVCRCLDAGLTAFMRRANVDAPAYTELWEIIFPHFFKDEQVAEQMARLLEGQNLNHKPLKIMAEKAGYQPEQFPELDFDAAIQEFEGAFLIQATHETTLQGIIEANQLLEQTRLAAETQAILEQIVALLQDVKLNEIVGISANSITATNVVGGDQHVYQLAPKNFPPRFPDHWESHYLRALLNQCDRLDVTPLSATEATTETLSIAAVFTTLYLDNITRTEDETVTDALSPLHKQAQPEEKERPDESEIKAKRYPITAIEAIAAMPRLVILGQPGGGKSTLVNYVAAQLARQRLGESDTPLPDWPTGQTPIPVRIVLRRFAEWLETGERSGTAGDVWDYLATLLGRWGCSDSFEGLRHTLIKSGGILFFDGLDEIRDAAARQMIIKGAVTDFANTEKRCQVVVTSRPYAYTEKAKWRLPVDLFPLVTLAPFADKQIEAFNQAWYIRVMGPRRGWDDEQCQQRASLLTRTLLALPHLHDMAASSLLLTLMAQVHSQGGALPDNRADLYRQTVELLLSRWENRIVLDARIGEDVQAEDVLWLGVTTTHLRDVLAQIAYKAHERQGEQAVFADGYNQAAEISRAELKLALVDRFDSGEKAEQIMAYIQNRAGLLLAQNESIYTFPHRTFQEYLAAQYLLGKSDGQEQLCTKVKAQPDWWREVFLLSAGSSMTVPKNVQDLVNTLLPLDPGRKGWPLTPELSIWVSIAAQALIETDFNYHVEQEEMPGGFTAVYERVQAWLKTIMTAEDLLPAAVRTEAGRWLARMGDDRPGVGVEPGTGLPDIVWSAELPAGTYIIGEESPKYSDERRREVQIDRPYRLSRYPITNAQFQCFIDAPDWDDSEWWKDVPPGEVKFDDPAFAYANHPRENVSWYQALAFSRWLNDKLGQGLLHNGELVAREYELLLLHEYEWEVAARWPNQGVQERIYPWGTEFDSAKANTSEGGIRQTTAVGLYPSGKNKALELYDLSGNVWEWCRNKYDNPEDDQFDDSGAERVVRGGSWYRYQDLARAAYRDRGHPADRNNGNGFRVVVRRPPSHHDH